MFTSTTGVQVDRGAEVAVSGCIDGQHLVTSVECYYIERAVMTIQRIHRLTDIMNRGLCDVHFPYTNAYKRKDHDEDRE